MANSIIARMQNLCPGYVTWAPLFARGPANGSVPVQVLPLVSRLEPSITCPCHGAAMPAQPTAALTGTYLSMPYIVVNDGSSPTLNPNLWTTSEPLEH